MGDGAEATGSLACSRQGEEVSGNWGGRAQKRWEWGKQGANESEPLGCGEFSLDPRRTPTPPSAQSASVTLTPIADQLTCQYLRWGQDQGA